jgi:hypothetical protein
MKRVVLLGLMLNATGNLLHAQDFNYDPKQTWEEKPVLHTVDKTYDSSSAVALLDERTIEYVKVKEDLLVYETDHVIIKIINDAGIEMYNKVYIPKYESSQIKNIKARTILPNGKVIDLSQDAVKEIQEDGRTYKLFALDGLEKVVRLNTHGWKKDHFLFLVQKFFSVVIFLQKKPGFCFLLLLI